MITHIRGRLIAKKPGEVVVEAGGLGYKVAVPLSTFMSLPESDNEVFLLTHLFIREESWDLFGFLTTLERESFRALTSVTRIGPRLALTVISALEPLDLAKALMTRDLAALAAIKGIGAKTAERLMLELKDKAPKLAALSGLTPEEIKANQLIVKSNDSTALNDDDEATSALINLGYSPIEAARGAGAAQKELGPNGDLGQIVKLALKNLTAGKSR
ncbi:MAG: Holliday junction branch migration protein RuvA [Candidatus Adiutrix sp.]